MTGKVIDSSATGLLVLILPIAFLIVLLLKAWPLLLALFIISISLRVWQQYQWKQWSKQINPYFNQLIKENQGCLTPLDLSITANLSGSAAQRYLDKKAEEFGAQRQVYEDKGPVYYFLTASALGSIFDNSEPPRELEGESFASQAPTLSDTLTQNEPNSSESQSSTNGFSEPLEASAEEDPSLSEGAFSTAEIVEALEPLPQPQPEDTESVDKEEDSSPESEGAFSTAEIVEALEPLPQPQPEDTESLNEQEDLSTESPDAESALSTAEIETVEPLPQPQPEDTELVDEQEDLWAEASENENKASESLIQAELAKRLDVHSSTVGKRKSDSDFSEWSQSRDPEGIAWEYSPDTKEFLPVQKKPQSKP
jgi:hypothetical protein